MGGKKILFSFLFLLILLTPVYAGMVSIEEAEELIRAGVTYQKLEYYGLEYRYLSRYLAGSLSYDEMFLQLNTAIHQFAKRQMTYFRGMEKRGIIIHWIDGALSLEEKTEQVISRYSSSQ